MLPWLRRWLLHGTSRLTSIVIEQPLPAENNPGIAPQQVVLQAQTTVIDVCCLQIGVNQVSALRSRMVVERA
jgi:hypothetical protein